ncbi:hypothetical protein TASIC1_0002079700 [Trichoderma asperellum]|uniref:CFEM domain-containing protein n=1 Tax=Trichoderma asperellum TaxID=101201 RepID=A0A6V8QN74_TRIAP|nr:hypothetical protein TASIC1_0002079700 [Trichoderma asperellum]
MRSLFPVVLGALGLIFVDGVVAQDTPACVPACANQVRDQFTQYSCTSAEDAACLCANANFGFGVRDCAKNRCGATDVQVQAFLAGPTTSILSYRRSSSSYFKRTNGKPSCNNTSRCHDASTNSSSHQRLDPRNIDPRNIDPLDFTAGHRSTNDNTASLDRSSNLISANVNCSTSNYHRRTLGNISVF